MSTNQSLDLMKLYSQGSANGWNEYLNKCYLENNINSLAKMKRAAQVGMSELVKRKLATEDINVWFCRLTKSIEITAKRIIKKVHPLPQDNPLLANEKEWTDYKKIKQKRDQELAKFLAMSSY